jgi:ABC-type multidrug transport system fused ATPase/permease subunit
LQDDLGLMVDEERVSSVYARFSSYWEEELLLPTEKRSLAKPMFKTIGKEKFIYALLLQLFLSASGFGPPLILKSLSSHFSSIPGMELVSSTLWTLSVLLFIIPVTGVIFGAKSYILFSHFGCIIRSSLIPAIYKKSLRLGNNSKVKFTTGQIVNLFGNDILHIQMFIQDFAEPFFAPAQLAVALSLIYEEVGVSMFAGFALIVVIVPLMLICILTFVKNRNAKLILGDERIKLTNEVLQGIRVLKYYAWEVAFKGKVDELRVKEVEALAKMNYLIVAIVALIVMVPVFMPILIFFTYISLGNQLNSTKAFTVLAYFALVQNPILLIPQLLQRTMLAYSSAIRIFNFLCCDELEPYVKTCDDSNDENTMICIKDGQLGWLRDVIETEITEIGIENDKINNKSYIPVSKVDESLEKSEISCEGDIELIIKNKEEVEEIRVNRSVNTLVNLNVNITKGQLVAVVGNVGSGKTSFLCGVLGELELMSGSVQCSAKSIAYHQQQPWIINDTMKANIIFGKPYNKEKLQHAIKAACLEPDLEILSRGIETEIGEKGITLSGGQKARVSFARTIYCESELYLLDDPLSAVDAHVGEHIFHKGIKQALKGKTVILVTHQVHFLDMCDLVLVFKDGLIISQGSPQEIKANGLDLENILANPIDENISSPDGVEENKIRSLSSDSAVSDSTLSRSRVQSISIEDAKSESVKIEKENKQKDLMTEEERVSGFVKLDVYDWYLRVGGYNFIYVLLITCIFTCVFYCYSNIYLADWGEESYIRVVKGDPFTAKENLSYFSTYTFLTLVTIIGTTARIAVMVTHGKFNI